MKRLWVDDHPDFLERFVYVFGRDRVKSVLEETTFVFDYVSAEEALAKNSFDMVILDGDFPYEMPQELRDQRGEYISRVITDGGVHVNMTSVLDVDSFSRFPSLYMNTLMDKEVDVVVFSANPVNFGLSYIVGVSFYLKGAMNAEDAQERLLRYGESVDTLLKYFNEEVIEQLQEEFKKYQGEKGKKVLLGEIQRYRLYVEKHIAGLVKDRSKGGLYDRLLRDENPRKVGVGGIKELGALLGLKRS